MKKLSLMTVAGFMLVFGLFSLANAQTAPSGLTATAGKCGSGTVNLSWTDNSGGSANFSIVRVGGLLSNNAGRDKNASVYQAKAGQSSYSVTNIKGDIKHKFYIAACNGGSCSDLVSSSEINPATNCSSVSYSFTVAASGNGSGTIIGKNGDSEIINCGSDCFEGNIAYDKTGKITFTATPNTGSVFSKWEGDSECNNLTSSTCSLSRTKSHNGLKAKFSKIGGTSDNASTVTLNLSKNGTGSGSIQLNNSEKTCDFSSSCSFSFGKGKNVFITIVPDSNSRVVTVSGGVVNFNNRDNYKCTLSSNENTKKDCYVKMTGNKNLTVNFATKSSGGSSSKYNLTIKNTGSVSGTVKLLDVDNNAYLNDLSNNFSCTAGINGGKCEFSVESGRKVKVLSYAGPVGYSADWSSANCSSSGVESSGWGYCKITMSGSNKEIEIKFTKSSSPSSTN